MRLAISDLGMGIRRSLSTAHPDVTDTCSGYIMRAIQGLTSRPGGRGGQGLGAIYRIVGADGGSLFIRSETGCVKAGVQSTLTLQDGLTFFPGTQVAITFRSRR